MAGFEIVSIAVGLSMDAFAVSISNGLSLKKVLVRKALTIALIFGFFQAIMPLLGFLLGMNFTDIISRFDHFIALIFLSFIGGKMLYDGIVSHKSKNKSGESNAEKIDNLKFTVLLFQAVATSIDALIVGISFSAMGLELNAALFGVAVIGAITFALCFIGVYAGKKFGEMLGSKAEIFGGLILVGIGIKVFVEHIAGG